MNPWVIAGGIAVVGAVVLTASVAAASEGDCEVTAEYGFPYWLCAVMIRRCETGDENAPLWLWDVATLEHVRLGAEMAIEHWPEPSLHFGQALNERAANDAAIAWIDANHGFVESGGKRGPLATRTEDFLAGLSPVQLDALRAVFEGIDPGIEGLIDRMRVAADDLEYRQIARQVGHKLQAADQDALQQAILDALGIGKALTLKGILDDAGVLDG